MARRSANKLLVAASIFIAVTCVLLLDRALNIIHLAGNGFGWKLFLVVLALLIRATAETQLRGTRESKINRKYKGNSPDEMLP